MPEAPIPWTIVNRLRRADTAPAPLSSEADLRVVRALSAAGAVLGRERLVQHYLVTRTRTGASTATLQLREAGFEASLFENPTAQGWIVVAERSEPLDEETVLMSRSLLELIASRCDAEYDGWHTDLLDSETAPDRGDGG